MSKKHAVLILGGGTGGLTVASRLLLADPGLDVAIVEPSEHHDYQPIWTLVGGGVFDRSISRRPEADYIPTGARWIKDRVVSFEPERREIGFRCVRADLFLLFTGPVSDLKPALRRRKAPLLLFLGATRGLDRRNPPSRRGSEVLSTLLVVSARGRKPRSGGASIPLRRPVPTVPSAVPPLPGAPS
jgi:NADPH-dependent 2,4-dienoyl-CoA reductase/sulfur reductase-like enzyme